MMPRTNSGYTVPKTVEEYEALRAEKMKANGGKNELGKDDFLNLLITQMQNQDPLDPMDNAAFTEQTTSFSQLEQMISMNKALEALVESQQQSDATKGGLIASAAFVGKTVEYNSDKMVIDGSTPPPISFYAGAGAVMGEARFYNKDGELMGVYPIDKMQSGQNTINWDGKTLGGVELQKGEYTMKLTAVDQDGKSVDIGTFGEGIVTGVKKAGDKTYIEVNGGLVDYDDIYSVKESKPKAANEN